jgi:hypothetical protein
MPMFVTLVPFLRLTIRKKKQRLHSEKPQKTNLEERMRTMAKMCKLGSSCSTHKGMCIHEKIMAGMMVMAMVAGLVYWLA